MRTLHIGLRVENLDRSLAFYQAIGYRVLGAVDGTAFGTLTMLRLPDDEFVTLELVHDPAKGSVDIGTGINHVVVQVESLDATIADLATSGIATERPTAHSEGGPWTSWLTDPDGYRIELVQWPDGHPLGMNEADLP